jgi:hypothetical protein
MEKKITKKDYFNQIIEVLSEHGTQEQVDFCKHEIELLEKKAQNKKKGVSEENRKLADVVLTVLADGKKLTVSEIQKSDVELSTLSTPKVTSLLNLLQTEGTVKREVEKGKPLFYAVAEVEVDETDAE